SYDYEEDPAGGLIWYNIAQQWAEEYPVRLADVEVITPEQIHDVVLRICRHFGRLLTHFGLKTFLYNDDGQLRKEGYAQLLFYGLAEAYCRANNLDISLQPQWGREMVMFKLSRGYQRRVFVAVKYSRNGNLVKQYQTAVEKFYEQEGDTVYVVIQTAESREVLYSLQKIRDTARQENNPMPELLIFDGRLDEWTNGMLWEFGLDGVNEQTSQPNGASQYETSLFHIANKLPPKDMPIGVAAKQFKIGRKRMQRWYNIHDYALQGLTQAEMAEREDIAIRTIQEDVADMKEAKVYPFVE
ncbi:MAG: hypothetical protein H6653_20275, partial [Ardenticatenaceae bacterium]|nr:hypothetical protein [Ardenticatenaceae bacterium]